MLKSSVRTTPDSRLTAFVSPPPINQLGRKLNVCSGFTTSCISITMATDEQMFCGLWTHVGLLVNLLATKTFRYCGVANIFRLECSDHAICMHESSALPMPVFCTLGIHLHYLWEIHYNCILTPEKMFCSGARGSHLYVAYRSICDCNQVFWSAKSVLDCLIVPFWSN